MCEWIRVKDKLPEIPEGCQEHPDPVLYISRYKRVLRAGFYGENGRFRAKYFRSHNDLYEGLDAEDVLCWMWQHDLPVPPEDDLD